LVRCLIQENVRFVSGIPGGQLCPILDGIRRLGHEAGLQFVMTRHEQAAAHMADAYARVTGQLRKAKRLPSNIRGQFNTAAGRRQNRAVFTEYLAAHPFSAEMFSRFLNYIRKLVSADTKDDVLTRGYF
jgi:hypothetical protein